MTTELWILVFSIGLGIFQILVAGAAVTKQRGSEWNVSARDGEPPPLKGMAGRLDRALQNFKETFPIFVASIAVVMLAQKNGNLSALGAQVYLGARILYLPAYAFGITYVRTLIWGASLLGIILILAQLF